MINQVKILLLFCALSFAQAKGSLPQSRAVRLGQGPVRGYRDANGGLYAFYSIPYATAPTGRDKYKAPLPAPTWSKTFEAVEKNITCPQIKGIIGNFTSKEQCLIANVFVPDTGKTNYPVLAYIHGGAYNRGYGNNENPSGIVKQGEIIVVNFNYRLGVHGFLCLGTSNVPGNAGMKDMVAFLQWVQDNISKFGGDPDNVTIAGYSSGSSAADLLSYSKTTDKLFHRVILESGVAINPWSVDAHPIYSAKRYAAIINFTTDNVDELEEFYLSTPLTNLTEESIILYPDTTLPFVPCVEKYTGSEMFLDDAPINILKKSKHSKRPIITGFTNMEGRVTLPFFTKWTEIMNKNFEEFLPVDLHFKNKKEREAVAKKVKEFYFNSKNASAETAQAYVDLNSDTSFIYHALRSLSLQAKAGNDAIFFYEYSFPDETCQRGFKGPVDVVGANHCAQTAALYDSVVPDRTKYSPECKKMKDFMRLLWINFIKTGCPLPKNSTQFAGGWPPATANRFPIFVIDKDSKLAHTEPLPDRMRLWDEIYAKHYKAPTCVDNMK